MRPGNQKMPLVHNYGVAGRNLVTRKKGARTDAPLYRRVCKPAVTSRNRGLCLVGLRALLAESPTAVVT